MDNRQIILRSRPVGSVKADCFEEREVPLRALEDGDVRIRNIYLSCDPYMRSQLGDGGGYKSAFALGSPIPARVVGRVEASKNPRFAVGDFVWGFLAWEEYTQVPNGDGLRKIDPALGPISHAISGLGMPGLTAYVGMLDLGNPSPGETVFVSAASGAVGQIAGQLARIRGARAVGAAGSDAKIEHVCDTLHFDAAFNYRSEASIGAALDRLCPNGIDVYFDNVGGETLDAVLARINGGARVAICGQISQYDNVGEPYGLRNIHALLATRSTMTGFSVRAHMDRFDPVVAELAGWMKKGQLVCIEDIVEGLENAPAAFIGMMSGDNIGKRLVQVSEDPTR